MLGVSGGAHSVRCAGSIPAAAVAARAHSSVVEHSPYKRGVTGSNPVAPTRQNVAPKRIVLGGRERTRVRARRFVGCMFALVKAVRACGRSDCRWLWERKWERNGS